MKQELVFEAPRRAMPPRHLADLDEAGRVAAVAELGLPAFRARQLANQYYGRLIADPHQMTDLPATVRAQVAEALFPDLLTPLRSIACDAGDTRKTLWRAGDGTTFESVLMRYPQRTTVCVSSQAGCGMACPFCATGQGGLTRNLSAAEILEQVRAAAVVARDDYGGQERSDPGNVTGGQERSDPGNATGGQERSDPGNVTGGQERSDPGDVTGGQERSDPGNVKPGRLSNVVFMGMGEPLANYNRVLAAVKRIIAPPPLGFGISARSVTVSTVGLAPAIRKLADEHLGVTLALSLHAPDDELRDTLVPVNNRWNVAEALDAARCYADATGRRVSVEYALIRDINDQPWRGDLLGKRLHGALGPLVHVNVIPLNPTPGSKWDASPKPAEREFVKRVRERGVSCTVRDTRGQEIAAACGQLAAEG